MCGLRSHPPDGGGDMGPHGATAAAQSESRRDHERDLVRAAWRSHLWL